ncbi:hypothetical protein Salat_1206600 [Sesamum alatum]|uniref:Uncharacterized protein n=1 Tax=Sesamum alatum TaxID=300844 RepID=A0AAE2CNV4_9LAMI|nr:hypothetical protein Salat_1206600 [Sesamum alatum]
MSSASNSVSALESSSNSPSHTSSWSFATSPTTVPPLLASNPNIEPNPLDIDRPLETLLEKKGTLPPSIVPQTDSSQPEASSLLSARGRSSGTWVILQAPMILLLRSAIEITSGDTEVAGENVDSAARTQPYNSKSPSVDKAKSKGKKVAEGLSERKKCKTKHHKSSRSNRSSKRSKSHSEKRQAKQAAKKVEEVENLKLVQELTEWWNPKCVSTEMEGEKLVPDWAISERSSVLKHMWDKTRESYIGPAFFLVIRPPWSPPRTPVSKSIMLMFSHSPVSKKLAIFSNLLPSKLLLRLRLPTSWTKALRDANSQVMKLKGFVEGFNLAWLDPTLDGNLVAFPEEETPAPVDDEFESLIEEVEKMDCPSLLVL